jgi:membrane protein
MQSFQEDAQTPLDVHKRGWRESVWALGHSIIRDRVFSLAAGVAFYAILAIFPALGVAITIYALFADASLVAAHLDLLAGVLPPGAAELLGEQMTRMGNAAGKTLGSTLGVNLALSLWSANAGVAALFDALNVVFKEEEKRSLLRFYATTLAFTLVAVLFLALALGLLVVLPIALKFIGWEGSGQTVLAAARWPTLFIGILFVLRSFYRHGPSRNPQNSAQWRWLSPGAVLAAMAWLLVSIAFSWYVSSFDSYSRMYGSLGAVMAFMIWLWLSSVVALLGAEIDAQWTDQTQGSSFPETTKAARFPGPPSNS